MIRRNDPLWSVVVVTSGLPVVRRKLVTTGGALLQSVHDGAPWQRVATNGIVTGTTRLMSLPGLLNET